jgi:hypothetical protein
MLYIEVFACDTILHNYHSLPFDLYSDAFVHTESLPPRICVEMPAPDHLMPNCCPFLPPTICAEPYRSCDFVHSLLPRTSCWKTLMQFVKLNLYDFLTNLPTHKRLITTTFDSLTSNFRLIKDRNIKMEQLLQYETLEHTRKNPTCQTLWNTHTKHSDSPHVLLFSFESNSSTVE